MNTTSRSLSIGIFIARWPPAHLGGAELQAARTARELAARGHRVHVFTREEAGIDGAESVPGMTLHPRSVAPLPGLRLLGEMWSGWRQARALRTDVNLCYITLNSGLLGHVVKRAQGTPFVIAIRATEEAMPVPATLRKRIERALHARADRLWVQSSFVRDHMQTGYEGAGLTRVWRHLEERIRIVGNGVDLPVDEVVDTVPSRRFVFIGRLVHQKELSTLIEAARRLPDVEVQLFGEGPREDALQAAARGTNVSFHGRCAPEEVAALIRASRALVLCSSSEGLPNVVLEALALGRPVIATAVGGVPELVQDGVNGLIVPVRQPDALAAAMQQLTEDATWRRLAGAARAAVERFAWPQIIDRIETELLEVVDSARPTAEDARVQEA